MPGFSSKMAYRRISNPSEQIRTRVPVTKRNQNEPQDNASVASVASATCINPSTSHCQNKEKELEPLQVPRSRKLCHWKPNVSTVFEDKTSKPQPPQIYEFLETFRNYFTDWITPKKAANNGSNYVSSR
mmetsp:Transcript_1174/g.2536  ORF Transcript_1174/g.2536 Transcript_1174/m.2536 type:complete len:129 (-) Transcript_1174:236-622(-)